MRKVIGVITARMSSTRLPGKVLKDIAGKSNFNHHVERMRQINGLSGIFLATSKDPLNEALIKEAEKLGCGWYAGAEQDVVERHIALCDREGADAVIRVTCDCPLFDMDCTTKFTEEFKKEYRDFIYVSNVPMIYGTLSELISSDALKKVHRHYRGPAVSQYIRENMEQFNTLDVVIDDDLYRPEYRLTLDYPADLEMIRHIYRGLYKGAPILLKDVYTWLDDHPEIGRINADVKVKDVNLYSANLVQKPLYMITESGGIHTILDAQRKPVDPIIFYKEITKLFPALEQYIEKQNRNQG